MKSLLYCHCGGHCTLLFCVIYYILLLKARHMLRIAHKFPLSFWLRYLHILSNSYLLTVDYTWYITKKTMKLLNYIACILSYHCFAKAKTLFCSCYIPSSQSSVWNMFGSLKLFLSKWVAQIISYRKYIKLIINKMFQMRRFQRKSTLFNITEI